MDGLACKFTGDILGDNFEQDKFGSVVPKPDKLLMDEAHKRIERQLSARTGFSDRLSGMYYRTDVEFTDNPLGNSPVIAFGMPQFGARPLKRKSFREKMQIVSGVDKATAKQLAKRERRIENYQSTVLDLHTKVKEAVKTDADDLIWRVEGEQAMTGGGFDNNYIGDVQKAALKFVVKSSVDIGYKDSVLSQLVVQACLEVRDYLESLGLKRGSLRPLGIGFVRFEQDNDGMMGFPACAKSKAPLTPDLAVRLLIESGIDTRRFVGSTVVDRNTGSESPYRLVDAVGYILDHSILRSTDLMSIVLLLARIQKHGWKQDGDGFIAKDGKTRSVYPNACIPGAVEAMTFSPFLKACQDARVPFLPSLQTRQVRNKMVWDALSDAIGKGYDYLAADWSQYDATVRGGILATVLQLVVKPFYSSQYYAWVDAATYILTYKYIVTDQALDSINGDLYAQARQSAKNFDVDRYSVFGLVDGLISGAKMTHVGGSLYGEVVIHRCIPRLCKHEPIFGAQAGDDTLLGWPISSIVTSSVDETYTPIATAAKLYGLDINPSKQIWQQYKGEVVKVFLQEVYQYNLDIRGVGSTFRPLDALPFSEHDKGLSIAEQEIATISRMNQGDGNPFLDYTIEFWLQHDQYLGVLFKEKGVNAINVLIDSIGYSVTELAQRIDVGSFTFGMDKADLSTGKIPIVKTMADVASKMSFTKTLQQALSALNYKSDEGKAAMDTHASDPTEDTGDVLAG